MSGQEQNISISITLEENKKTDAFPGAIHIACQVQFRQQLS